MTAIKEPTQTNTEMIEKQNNSTDDGCNQTTQYSAKVSVKPKQKETAVVKQQTSSSKSTKQKDKKERRRDSDKAKKHRGELKTSKTKSMVRITYYHT